MPSFRACAWPVASVTAAALADITGIARSHGNGAALVSSCQRIEVFHFANCSCAAPVRLAGRDALTRLAEVAAGLHSVVLGEVQVLGQVRAGLAEASPEVGRLGAVAIAAARALRAETRFNAHTGHLLDRALHIAGLEPGGRIAVVGAGAVGRLVAERALTLGFPEVTVVARRFPAATWFSPGVMRYVPLESLPTAGGFDVLVTCLGSAAEPLAPDVLPPVGKLIADLGTPRNVATVPNGARLVTIAEMLAGDASGHSAARREALRVRLGELLDERLAMLAADSRTAVGRLRLDVERLRAEEARRIGSLHPELTPQAVDAITRSLVNRIFHLPTERLRALNDAALGERLAALFALEPEEVQT